jgi:hypothetical protein
MKRLLLSSFLFFLFHSVFAQQQYFIYLESENGIPFYVRLGDKIYSSSSPGYLIFPNLSDSSYTLFIGIPSQGGNESRFQLMVQGNDHGYSIKTGESELQLADLQSQIIVNPVHMPGTANVTYEPRKDAFSSMLSKASNDSSLLMVPVFSKADPPVVTVPKKEVEAAKTTDKSIVQETSTTEPPQSTTPVASQNSTAEALSLGKDSVLKNTDATALPTQQKAGDDKPVSEKAEVLVQPEIKKDQGVGSGETGSASNPLPGVEIYKKSVIKKYSESSTSEGFGLVYFDADGGQVDTIRMLIPNPKIVFKETDTGKNPDVAFMEVKKDPEPSKETIKEKSPSKDPVVTKEESITKDNSITEKPAELITKDEPSKAERSVGGIIPAKPKCRAQASESDFFKLRKNMASEESDELMVEQAMKSFKNKCYTTEQVKYLSSLFLTSAGKYLFFDAAYMHVSDRENFPSLQSEIKDDYYSRRFKALIGE